jgi:hypothetical protein
MTSTRTHREAASTTSEATRYLCAAAYLDRLFAGSVISRVLEEEHRAVVPSYGVDLVPVVLHCLAAQRRRLIRDVILAALLLVAWPVLSAASDAPVGAALRIVLLAWGIVFVSSCLNRYEVLAPRMMRGHFDPNLAPAPLSERHARLLRELERNEQGNVTVYSGFSPFVGCGFDLGGWSFAADTRKGKEQLDRRLEPIPFEVEELYDEVTASLRGLDMAHLSTEDRLFVNGQDIRDQPWILPDRFARPLASVDPALVQQFLRTPTQRARHYLCVQLVDWQGELVLSIFLRFTQVGGNLFTEASYFFLPPLREQYHAVDDLRPMPDTQAAARLVVGACVATPFLLVLSPLLAGGRLLSRLGRWLERRSVRRRIKATPRFDYGAVTSVRQSGTSTDYRHYFQKLDKEMYVKIVEQRILNSIIDFLEQHNIDTSDLKERQTTIMNSGVILSGGSIQAESLAVGTGARARVGQVLKTVAKATPKPTPKP